MNASSADRDRRLPVRTGTLTAVLAASMLLAFGFLLVVVLGGRRPPISTEARMLEEDLAATRPDVIVLGSSTADASLDVAALGEGLGARVSKVWAPASKTPTWYLMMKNRVYANGHNPRLVVVPTILASALATAPGSRNETVLLLKHMGASEPLVERKALSRGAWFPLSYRAQRNAQRVRDAVLWWAPRTVVATVMGLRGGGVAVAGDLRTDRAMASVFALDRMLNERLVVDGASPREAAGSLPPAAEGMVPDLVDLVHEHGGHIVFVRIPPAPGHADKDPVTFPEEHALVQLLNERGAGYLDARPLQLGPDDYLDYVHLDASGRSRLTTALLRAIGNWGGLELTAIPPAPLPVSPPAITRTGVVDIDVEVATVPIDHPSCTRGVEHPLFARFSEGALRALDYGRLDFPLGLFQGDRALAPSKGGTGECAPGEYLARGSRIRFNPYPDLPAEVLHIRPSAAATDENEVSWLFPGTTVELRFEDAASQPRHAFVEVQVQPFGPTDPARGPTVQSLGAQPLPFEGHGGRMRARLEVDMPASGPWAMRVDNPRGNPVLALHSVRVGSSPRKLQTVHVIPGATVDTLVEVVGPPVEELTIQWPPGPDTLPTAATDLTVQAGPAPGVGIVDLPQLAFLSGACSPVILYEDGQPLKNQFNVVRRSHKCEEVHRMPGSSCHRADRMWFSTADLTDPASNGRKYSAAIRRLPGLTPLCTGKFWLLPGDTVTVKVDPARLRTLFRGANLLTLSGFPSSRQGRVDGTLHVAVHAEGVLHGEWAVPTLAIKHDAAFVELRHLAPDAREVTVTFANPEDGDYILLAKATLAEADPAELERLRPRGSKAPY